MCPLNLSIHFGFNHKIGRLKILLVCKHFSRDIVFRRDGNIPSLTIIVSSEQWSRNYFESWCQDFGWNFLNKMGAWDPIGWDPLSQWLGYMDTSQYQSHFKRFFMVLEHLICMAVLPNRNAHLHEEVTLCKNFVFIYLFCIKVPQAFGIWIIFSQIEGCMQWWTVDKTSHCCKNWHEIELKLIKWEGLPIRIEYWLRFDLLSAESWEQLCRHKVGSQICNVHLMRTQAQAGELK